MPTAKRRSNRMNPSTMIRRDKAVPKKRWTHKNINDWDSTTKSLGGKKNDTGRS